MSQPARKLRKKNMSDEELLKWLKEQARVDENGCWNWTKQVNRDGYGQISYHGKTMLVHRLIYTLVHNTELNPSQLILHNCHNRSCFLIDHLKTGTASENMKDSYLECPYKERDRKRSTLKPHTCTLENPTELGRYIKSVCHVDNESGCWEYPLARNERYGMIRISGKTYRTHRLMLALRLGKAYDDLQVTRHLCHVKSCCNPAHLAEGTHRQNMLDSRTGILSEENVLEILKFCISKTGQLWSGTEIDRFYADKFGVTPSAVQSVRNGHCWADIYEKTIVKHKREDLLKKRKLIENDVREILVFSMSEEGKAMYGKDIDNLFAAKFAISPSTVGAIRRGSSWHSIYQELGADPNKLAKDHFRNIKNRRG